MTTQELEFAAALTPADRAVLASLADAVAWSPRMRAIAVVPRCPEWGEVISMHFAEYVDYRLPYPLIVLSPVA